MKSIIKQIYNGDLCISERTTACVSEFRTARDIAVQAHDTFEDKLCQPMKQEFDEYLSKESDVSAYHIEQAFTDGFKVGAQMMLEILEVGRDD